MMTEGKLAICKMEVFNEFSEEVITTISALLEKGAQKIDYDITSYVEYCVQLLENNGWGEGYAAEVQKFIEENFSLLAILAGADGSVEWRAEMIQGSPRFYFDLTLL